MTYIIYVHEPAESDLFPSRRSAALEVFKNFLLLYISDEVGSQVEK